MWEVGCITAYLPEDVVIQAEVNKKYQEIPKLNKIPDFLLHKPSTNKNYAVIEFKRAFYENTFNSDIKEDFDKLVAFKQELGYDHLIEVVIGEENQLRAAKAHITRDLNSLDGEEIIIIEFDTGSWRANHYDIRYTKRSI